MKGLAERCKDAEHSQRLAQLEKKVDVLKASNHQLTLLTASNGRHRDTLDQGGVQLALQLQQPLLTALLTQLKAVTPCRSAAPITADNTPDTSGKQEYDSIIRTYSSGHDLFGLRWADFTRSSASQLEEIISAASGLAHRRALRRLFEDAQHV